MLPVVHRHVESQLVCTAALVACRGTATFDCLSCEFAAVKVLFNSYRGLAALHNGTDAIDVLPCSCADKVGA